MMDSNILIDSCGKLVTHPNIKLFLQLELFLIIGTLILRTVRLGRVIHWAGRFAVNLTTTLVFWIISLGVIPAIVFGESYTALVNEIISKY